MSVPLGKKISNKIVNVYYDQFVAAKMSSEQPNMTMSILNLILT